ncbi:hypothetical protein FV233_22865 [Methylobacterium sp. WL7]|nr:hypothetical protein FV233_22865 [Methylobacterium sp. WL7]
MSGLPARPAVAYDVRRSFPAKRDLLPFPHGLSASPIPGCGAGPLSRAGEGQGEGCDLSGKTWSLTPTLSRTGEGARRGFGKPMCEHRSPHGRGDPRRIRRCLSL